MKVLPTTAYCMNLDNRTDRWQQVTKDFKRLQDVMDVSIERVSAVANPQRPSVGVAETFKKIISIAQGNSLPYVLILEDDLFVIDAQIVFDSLNNVPDDWDVLLGGVYHYIPDKKHDQWWMKMKDFCSLHFIIIRDRIYDKVLALNATSQHMDRLLGSETRKGAVNTYLIHPMPCQQRPGFSNIRKRQVNDNRRKLPWVDHPDTLNS